MEKLGALAAFSTAVLWSMSAVMFEAAIRRAGALAVNFWKVFLAFFLLALAGLLTRGMPLPLDASPKAWFYLAVSGGFGFIIADNFLFNAYRLIGSRITVIFNALQPIFTAALAYIFLGEAMRSGSVIAMCVVVTGILVTVLARNSAAKGAAAPGAGGTGNGTGDGTGNGAPAAAPPFRGYVYALLSALFQAFGMITSKIGLGSYDAISGTQIRVLVGMIGFAVQALVMRQAATVFVRLPAEPRALRATAAGAVLGPFLGVTLSLVALQNTGAGAASTLIALTPVLIIVPSVLILKQKVRPLEIAGACIAVSGAALFFLL